ncbi:hypothetical protein CXG81DRAFT_19693, partial [Caulochytrium protostelioides]
GSAPPSPTRGAGTRRGRGRGGRRRALPGRSLHPSSAGAPTSPRSSPQAAAAAAAAAAGKRVGGTKRDAPDLPTKPEPEPDSPGPHSLQPSRKRTPRPAPTPASLDRDHDDATTSGHDDDDDDGDDDDDDDNDDDDDDDEASEPSDDGDDDDDDDDAVPGARPATARPLRRAAAAGARRPTPLNSRGEPRQRCIWSREAETELLTRILALKLVHGVAGSRAAWFPALAEALERGGFGVFTAASVASLLSRFRYRWTVTNQLLTRPGFEWDDAEGMLRAPAHVWAAARRAFPKRCPLGQRRFRHYRRATLLFDAEPIASLHAWLAEHVPTARREAAAAAVARDPAAFHQLSPHAAAAVAAASRAHPGRLGAAAAVGPAAAIVGAATAPGVVSIVAAVGPTASDAARIDAAAARIDAVAARADAAAAAAAAGVGAPLSPAVMSSATTDGGAAFFLCKLG